MVFLRPLCYAGIGGSDVRRRFCGTWACVSGIDKALQCLREFRHYRLYCREWVFAKSSIHRKLPFGHS